MSIEELRTDIAATLRDAPDALSGHQILERLGQVAERGIGPAMLHYLLQQLEAERVVRSAERVIEVPGPRGATRREPRRVYSWAPG